LIGACFVHGQERKSPIFGGKEVRWPDGCKVVKLNKRRLAEKEVPVDLEVFLFTISGCLVLPLPKTRAVWGVFRLKFQDKAEKLGFSLLQKYPKNRKLFHSLVKRRATL